MRTLKRVSFLLGLTLTKLAFSQTIESLEWVPSQDAPVARVVFGANVRLLGQAPSQGSPTDLAQIGFELIAPDETVRNQSVQEGRRLKGLASNPAVDLTYVPTGKAYTKVLDLQFSGKVMLRTRQTGPRTLELVLGPTPRNVMAAASLPQPASSVAEKRFSLLLQSTPEGNPVNAPRIPADFQNYEVYTENNVHTGTKMTDLFLGYFKNEQDAIAVLERARQTFPAASVHSLVQPSVSTVPTRATQPAVPEVEVTVADVDGSAAALLSNARSAYEQKRYADAVEALNRTLMLPPNNSTPAAQELIGLAWEGMGRPDKAKAEYKLYVALYPNGEAFARVAQRLEAIGSAASSESGPEKSGSGDKAGRNRLNASGSVSQYYYGGQTKTDSLVNIATGIDQSTLTKTNQSVLVSSWDATGRYETDESVTKLVMRGSHSDNFATSSLTSATQGLVSAAYVDYRYLPNRLDLRVGRQSAIGGSMFGLFDGVSMAMPIGEKYKLDAMVGVPANSLIAAPAQQFAGVMLEADSLFEHWGGNLSLVDQTTEGISDRRALGLEVRYFGESLSMFTQMDYDINFGVLNALTVQGSAQGPYDTTVTMLVDNRKAPSLQLSDALISSGKTSLSSLLQTMSLNQAQSLALSTAAEARQAMVSVSRSLSPKWQASMDLRYSDVGALPAVGSFQAQPSTGAQYNASFQLTGSNLYSAHDINGFNVSNITSDTMNGTQFAYNNLTGFLGGKLNLEPSIRYYMQTDNTQTKVSRVSPGLRVSYKLSDRSSVMGEGIYEVSNTDGPLNHEASESYFFYVGYRYDIQ